MKGSEKQIKWAEDIIANAYKTLDTLEKELEIRGVDPRYCLNNINKEAIDVQRASIDKVVNSIDEASMIINRRNIFSREKMVEIGRNWMKANGQL